MDMLQLDPTVHDPLLALWVVFTAMQQGNLKVPANLIGQGR